MSVTRLDQWWVGAILVLLLATTAAAQDAINPDGLAGPASRPYSPYADRAFPTEVYFGDTHVHTALSADAGGGTRLLPRDAYRFARGEQVTSNTGQRVKLARALNRDFNAGGETALRAALKLTATFAQGNVPEALNYQPGNPSYRRVWDDIAAAAEAFNDRPADARALLRRLELRRRSYPAA